MVDAAQTPTTRVPSTTIARAGAALALVLAGLVPLLAGPAAAEAQPDLVVERLHVDAFEVVGGERLEAEAEVANVGEAPANETTLAFRLDDGREFRVEVDELEPGDGDVAFAEWTAEAGNHTVFAVADADDNVTEANEENNALATTYDVDPRPRPDLEATVNVGPYDRLVDGDELGAEIEVANTADPEHDERFAVADTFVVEISRDGDLVKRVRTDFELEPGDETDERIGPWDATTGNHSITVSVDAADEVDESDETDNDHVHEFRVFDSHGPPNLRAGGVHVAHEEEADRPIVEGDRVLIHAAVDHSGAAVDAFEMRIGLDGAPLDDEDGGPLQPRVGFLRRITWTAEPGNHTATLALDTTDTVNETHEADNRASTSFRVLEQANPAVTEVSVREPVVPWAGHEVRVHLANAGEGPMVAPATLDVEVCGSGSARLADGCQGLEAPANVTLAAGAERVVETTWDTTGQVGSYEVCAELSYPVVQESTADESACEDTHAVATAGPGASAGR